MLLLHPGRRVIPPSGVAASRATQTHSPTSAARSMLTSSGMLCQHSGNTRSLLDKCQLSFSDHTHLPLSRTRKEGKCGVGETASSHFFCFLHWGAAERLRKGARWTGCGVIWVCTRQGPPEDWGSFVCCDAFLHDLVDDVRNNLVSSELLTTLDGLWNWPCCARLMRVHHFWCFLAKGLKCWPIVIKR